MTNEEKNLTAAKAQCERMGIDAKRVADVEAAGRQAGQVKGSWYVPKRLKVENTFDNDALFEVCRAAWILESGEKPTGG